MKVIWKFALEFEWKFALEFERESTLKLPKDCEILKLDLQGTNAIMLWVIADTEASMEERKVTMLYTGERFEEAPGKYLGSVLLNGGSFVGHYFIKEKQ